MSNLQSSPFRSEIGEYFNYSFDFDFLELVADCLDRIEVDTPSDYLSIEEQIGEYIDTLDNFKLWRIMMFYQTPASAKLEMALIEFSNAVEYIYCDAKK